MASLNHSSFPPRPAAGTVMVFSPRPLTSAFEWTFAGFSFPSRTDLARPRSGDHNDRRASCYILTSPRRVGVHGKWRFNTMPLWLKKAGRLFVLHSLHWRDLSRSMHRPLREL